jgi:hypothetical protein
MPDGSIETCVATMALGSTSMQKKRPAPLQAATGR